MNPTSIVYAAAIGLRGQRVALVAGADGWELPAAPVGLGQSPELIALSILQQRAGVPAAIDRLSGVYSDEHGLLIAYRASLDEGEPREGVSFFAPDSLPAHIHSSLHVAALADWAAASVPGQKRVPICFWEVRFMGISERHPTMASVDRFRPGSIHHTPAACSVSR